jgi:hypothetical protein
MSISIYTIDNDNVIKSKVITGKTTYGFAVDRIYPLIDRFAAQRKLQNASFYERLRRDLIKGCVMPPITIAMVDTNQLNFNNENDAQIYANAHIDAAYVLDGMQRLNALYQVKDEEGFDRNRTLFINLIISSNKDMLLYRMITLNNGQKPMTPRHQIEVLTEELFDFEKHEIEVQTEKERAEKIKRGSFNLADISKGYLAFFSGSVHNDNNKIISEKMDEIIVENIMKSAASGSTLEFQKILDLIDKYAQNSLAKDWLQTQNNLIGFCVGVKKSYDHMYTISADEFGSYADKFDKVFKSIDAAKVNLGKFRRELSKKYIEKIEELKNYDEVELLSFFSDETAQ